MFEGRLRDVVSRGGERINCEEVERLCVAHSGIAAAAAVAMPDPAYGERACAFFVPMAGKDAPTVPELGGFLESRGLAKFKSPERVEVVANFLLTSSGKLSRPKLRDAIAAKLRDADAPAPAGSMSGANVFA